MALRSVPASRSAGRTTTRDSAESRRLRTSRPKGRPSVEVNPTSGERSFQAETAVTLLVIAACVVLACLVTIVAEDPASVAQLGLVENVVEGWRRLTGIPDGTRLSLLQTLAGIAVAATIALEATVRRGQALALDLRAGTDQALIAQELRRLDSVTRAEWFTCVVLVAACLLLAGAAWQSDQAGSSLETLIALVLAGWLVNEVRKVHASMSFAYDALAARRAADVARARRVAGEHDPALRRRADRTVARIVVALALAPLPLLAPFDEADPWVLVLNVLVIITSIRMARAAAVDHGFGAGFLETAAKILLATLLALVDVLVLAAAILVTGTGGYIGAATLAVVILGSLAVLTAGFAGRWPIAFVRELVRSDVAARHDRVAAVGPVDVLLR